MVINSREYDKLETARAISQIWDVLTADERTLLLQRIQINTYQKNEIIHDEGTDPQFMMCLMQGKVKVYMSGEVGRNSIIRVIKPLELFGYRAFFTDDKYHTSAAAFEDCVIAAIPLVIIDKLVNENPKVGLCLIKDLCGYLGHADNRTVSLTQKHVRGRMAETLLFLEETYGYEQDQHTLSIYISREDIACMSNMTTANAIRTLSSFVNDKIITTDGRKIKIIDEQKLRETSRTG